MGISDLELSLNVEMLYLRRDMDGSTFSEDTQPSISAGRSNQLGPMVSSANVDIGEYLMEHCPGYAEAFNQQEVHGFGQTKARPSICTLPTEFFLIITKNLPLSSEASLALTCKRLNFAISTKSWGNLLTNVFEKKFLLNLLASDLSYLLPCKKCVKLLYVDESRNRHRRQHRSAFYSIAYSVTVSFETIQMATQAWRFGLEQRHMLMIDRFDPSRLDRLTKKWWRADAKARVIEGRFLLKQAVVVNLDIVEVLHRRQYLVSTEGPEYGGSESELSMLQSKAYQDQLRSLCILIDCHTLVISGVTILAECLLCQAETHCTANSGVRKQIATGNYRCSHCATEISLVVDIHCITQVYLIMSVYKDLGAGLIGDDSAWASHVDKSSKMGYEPTPFHRGCSTGAYETPDLANKNLHKSIRAFRTRLCVLQEYRRWKTDEKSYVVDVET